MVHQEFQYEILYTRAAEKFFVVHEKVREQYENALRELLLGEHPEKVDVKRIKGKRNAYYRMRIGDNRIIYTIINGKIIVVTTLLAGSRGDIYKKMNGLQ